MDSHVASTTGASVEEHDHPKHVAHHFDDAHQQFDTGKFGMWMFLITEVMFFAGLFVLYTVFRSNHPEAWQFAAQFLDTKWGAINTVVLLVSSFTVAWAVRNAQLGEKRKMLINLFITLLCAGGFMVIKYIEYSHKIHAGLVFPELEHSLFNPDITAAASAELAAYEHGEIFDKIQALDPVERNWVGKFFSIYFCLTGLHGIHVMAGMVVLSWLILRGMRGDFGPENFNAVDFGALYWHIVDLVWIFLFPLLYLIN